MGPEFGPVFGASEYLYISRGLRKRSHFGACILVLANHFRAHFWNRTIWTRAGGWAAGLGGWLGWGLGWAGWAGLGVGWAGLGWAGLGWAGCNGPSCVAGRVGWAWAGAGPGQGWHQPSIKLPNQQGKTFRVSQR